MIDLNSMKLPYTVARGESDRIETALRAAGYHLHHDAWCRGYVSRKCAGILSPYKGRFGAGVVWDAPSWSSTHYCVREYWIR